MLGQMINFTKSAIIFSKNCFDIDKDSNNEVLGQLQWNNIGLYLGLPAIVGRSKIKMLEFIKDRVKFKIKGWKNNF